MRRIMLIAVAVVTGAAALLVTPQTAGAWGRQVNRVKTAAEDGHAQTGMGPGWVMLSYKANGPMVGYLFAPGFTFADGTRKSASDHMDIRDTGNASAGNTEGITRWPWGFAAGRFDGCAYAYGTRKFAVSRAGFQTSRCADGPHVRGSAKPGGPPDALRWWHSERVFCRATGVDPLCSPYGVWSANKGGGLKVTSTTRACKVWANIGSSAVYGGGGAQQSGLLGTVPNDAQVDVRYVISTRHWVMAKWHDHRLAGGIAWAFFPRSCLR